MNARMARFKQLAVLAGLALALVASGAAPLVGGYETTAAKSKGRRPKPASPPTITTITQTQTRLVSRTQTFASRGAIEIPNASPGLALANPYPATIAVNGFTNGRITDVNVRLRNINHTYPDDLDIMLVKGATTVFLMSDAGEADDVIDLNLTLDDEAAASLPDAKALANGTYLPTNFEVGDAFPAPALAPSGSTSLTAFDGLDPNGQWQLFIVDDYAFGEPGSITAGWELEITAQVKETTTIGRPNDVAEQPASLKGKKGRKGGKGGKQSKGKK